MDISGPAQPPSSRQLNGLLELEYDLDQTTRQLMVISGRVAAMRQDWASARPSVAPPAPVPSPPFTQPPAVVRPTPAPAQPWWQRDGAIARVLSAVGAGVLLIGITFLLVLAIQHGYFGPVPRVVVGGAVAVVLVGLGLLIHRRQPGNAGAVALVATGVAGGYLDVVAVTTIYGWVDLWLGLAIAALVAAGGLVVSRRWESQVLAVIAVLGMVILAPVVGHDQPWSASAFLILVSASATWAHHDRRWPVLQAARVAPTALVLTLSALLSASGPVIAGWSISAELAYAVLATVFALTTLLGEGWLIFRNRDGIIGAVTVGLAVLPALVLVPRIGEHTSAAVWLIALASVWILAAALVRRPALAAVLLSAGALALVSALAEVEQINLVVPGLLAVATTYLAVSIARGSRVLGWVGIGFGALGLLGFAEIAGPLLSGPDLSAATGSTTFDAGDLLASALGVAVAGLGTRFVSPAVRAVGRTWTLVAGWAFGLLSVTGFSVSLGVMIGRTVDQVGSGFIAGQAGATLAWMAGAAWLLVRSRQRVALRHPAGRRHLSIGMALAGLAVAKLLLFDLSTLDGLIRVLAFIVAGAVLLTLGTLYARSLSAARDQA